jgi:hypothetical protein
MALGEWVCGMNLDGRCTGGVDLNDGRSVEVHAKEERGAWHEPRQWARGWREPRWRAHGRGTHGGVSHRHRGGREGGAATGGCVVGK